MQLVQLKKPFVPSIDKKKLIEALAPVRPGEIVTYEALSGHIGRDVLTCRWLLDSARRSAERDGLVFEAVARVGLRRLTNEEVPNCGLNAVAKGRRVHIRGAKKVKCADYDALPEKARTTYNLSLSLLGGLTLLTKPSRVKKVEAAVRVRLDPRDTIRLFIGKTKS